MEFEDEHDEDHEEEDDDEDEGEEITIPPPPLPPQPHPPPSYDRFTNPVQTLTRVNPERRSGAVRYRECQKNHAVNIGGHALDGCGEFMPAGQEGTLDALKCAACNCHRNFHRRETTAQHHHQVSPTYYRTPGGGGYFQQRQLVARPSTSGGTHSGEIDDSGGGVMRKRFRTKFTGEQKEKMMAFAEKLGWRIQKHDEAAVQQFCAQLNIRRQVFKVWMHNNKNTHGKKQP